MRFCDLAQIENLLNVLDNDRRPTDQQMLRPVRRSIGRPRSLLKKRNFERARARAVAE